ncbi:MAG: hypothetical protein ACO3C6_08705, partial [Steroidobacteraceae bacterium]
AKRDLLEGQPKDFIDRNIQLRELTSMVPQHRREQYPVYGHKLFVVASAYDFGYGGRQILEVMVISKVGRQGFIRLSSK